MSIPLRIAAAALIMTSPLALAATKPVPAKPATKPAAKATPAAKPAAAAKSATKPVAKPKPKLAAPQLNVGEKYGFAVMQLAAPDTAKFIADWKVGAGAKTATTRTVANQPLFTFLIFRGCKPDPMGKCDVVADFAITRPDGSVNEDNKGFIVWNKAAPDDPKKPYISDGALGYGVDDEGPFGDYRVVATITDRVAGLTVTTEQTLTIKPAEPAAAPAATPEPAPAK